jgi:hypothetical protein
VSTPHTDKFRFDSQVATLPEVADASSFPQTPQKTVVVDRVAKDHRHVKTGLNDLWGDAEAPKCGAPAFYHIVLCNRCGYP